MLRRAGREFSVFWTRIDTDLHCSLASLVSLANSALKASFVANFAFDHKAIKMGFFAWYNHEHRHRAPWPRSDVNRVTVVADTREQEPYAFDPGRTEVVRCTLPAGGLFHRGTRGLGGGRMFNGRHQRREVRASVCMPLLGILSPYISRPPVTLITCPVIQLA